MKIMHMDDSLPCSDDRVQCAQYGDTAFCDL